MLATNALHIYFIALVVGAKSTQSVLSSIGTTCSIPNESSNGSCVIKEDCLPYMNLLYNTSLTTDKINFMMALECDNRNYLDETIVCCPSNNTEYRNASVVINYDNIPNESNGIDKNNTFQLVERLDLDGTIDTEDDLLPSRYECADYNLDNRIYGGDFAKLAEFPWMALLVYNTNSSSPYGCGGMLISKRYVLTAAHCVTGEKFRSKCGLKHVLLGEYNIETSPDCQFQQRNSIKNCADPVVEVGVEKITVHRQYNDNSKHRHHDIALLRLNADVKYSQYIKPICLPVDELKTGLIVGSMLTVCGWGRTNVYVHKYGITHSSVLLKVLLPIIDTDVCSDAYSMHNLHIGPGQVCAGGVRNKDSCVGDSGGPLMYRQKGSWIASGIVSFGAEQCGTKGKPGIYTRIEYYTDWIKSNLEK